MLYGEAKKSGEIVCVNFDEILMVTMNGGRVPVLTTKEDEYLLVTKFNQLKKILRENDFVKSDRGVLVNVKFIEKYDSKNRLLILDEKKRICATVSESREYSFIDHMD